MTSTLPPLPAFPTNEEVDAYVDAAVEAHPETIARKAEKAARANAKRLASREANAAAREWLRYALVSKISEAYNRYEAAKIVAKREGWTATEPKLTVSLLAYDVASELGRQGVRGSRESMVRGQLERLVNEGKLVASTGIGCDGREARMYEPKR